MDDFEGESPFAVIAKYQKSAPVDVAAIARDLGIRVEYKDLGDFSGMLVQDRIPKSRSGYTITVNSRHHPNRQRFTLAHEIAHFVLHRDLVPSQHIDNAMYRSSLNNAMESQANRLAADILMPLAAIRREWARLKDGRAMARHFLVSDQAMQIRLQAVTRRGAPPAMADR